MQMPRPAYAVFPQIRQCLNANPVVRRRCHLPDVEQVVLLSGSVARPQVWNRLQVCRVGSVERSCNLP